MKAFIQLKINHEHLPCISRTPNLATKTLTAMQEQLRSNQKLLKLKIVCPFDKMEPHPGHG